MALSCMGSGTSCMLCVIRRFQLSGVPQEILEDSKFVPINEDDPRFGPPVSKSPPSFHICWRSSKTLI